MALTKVFEFKQSKNIFQKYPTLEKNFKISQFVDKKV